MVLVKIEDSPEPDLQPDAMPTGTASLNSTSPTHPVDPKDPEGFLRRCSGHNKKTKARCSAVIGKNAHSKLARPGHLPTCHAHRDQKSLAGWCTFMGSNREPCGRLFRWKPPFFELCTEHMGHPETPCHFMKLPVELRLEIFRYLLPTLPIGSSTAPGHRSQCSADHNQYWINVALGKMPGIYPWNPNLTPALPSTRDPHWNAWRCSGSHDSVFPMPFLDLLLINRQLYTEVKDLMYSVVPFTIDIRKDGMFMCGRRLLEPRRADGTQHFTANDVEATKKKFLKTFDFAAVKNYNVDILVENWSDNPGGPGNIYSTWDEEVEIYDIRDYVGVVVSGVLSLARNLCKLNVKLGFSDFNWTEEELITNSTCLLGPFERLRNVRQPHLCGVYKSTAARTNFMINTPMPPPRTSRSTQHNDLSNPLCSIPALRQEVQVLGPSHAEYNAYREKWERWVSLTADKPLQKPPIRRMFSEFKEFYTKIAVVVSAVTTHKGRQAFLHRARVARETENVEAFRLLRNELIQYWYSYLEDEERKKNDINDQLSKMLDTDVYPSHDFDDFPVRGTIPANPIVLDGEPTVLSLNKTPPRPATRPSAPAQVQTQVQSDQSMALNPQKQSHRLQAQAQARAQAAMRRAHLHHMSCNRPSQPQPQSQQSSSPSSFMGSPPRPSDISQLTDCQRMCMQRQLMAQQQYRAQLAYHQSGATMSCFSGAARPAHIAMPVMPTQAPTEWQPVPLRHEMAAIEPMGMEGEECWSTLDEAGPSGLGKRGREDDGDVEEGVEKKARVDSGAGLEDGSGGVSGEIFVRQDGYTGKGKGRAVDVYQEVC